MGDGERQEGQVWEAAMSVAHYGLDHIIAFVDHNGLQIDSPNSHVMTISPLIDKYRAFGWNAIQIGGHDLDAIDHAITEAKRNEGKPTVIVCETVKGKGVSFMEDVVDWHGIAPNEEQAQTALAEIAAL
jgi:transketolase